MEQFEQVRRDHAREGVSIRELAKRHGVPPRQTATNTNHWISRSYPRTSPRKTDRAARLRRGRPARHTCSLGPDIVPDQDPLREHRATPERSLDQRMDALSTANEVRTLRAQLKRDLKAGRVSIDALLLTPPPYLETAKVFDMLLAVPKVGRVKATKILHSCQVSPNKTFGGLSERQRAELAGRLDRS
jgi:hypothetical protein